MFTKATLMYKKKPHVNFGQRHRSLVLTDRDWVENFKPKSKQSNKKSQWCHTLSYFKTYLHLAHVMKRSGKERHHIKVLKDLLYQCVFRTIAGCWLDINKWNEVDKKNRKYFLVCHFGFIRGIFWFHHGCKETSQSNRLLCICSLFAFSFLSLFFP